VRLAPKRSMAPQAPKRVASAPNPTPEAVRPYTRSKTGSGKWTEVTDAGIRLEWARELSEICQGLAVARLIFNTDRTEDGVIMSLLKEALELREKMQATDKMADTVNSLGMLKQKQKAYKDAENYFLKSLQLRQQLKESFGVKEKAQAIAQSLTSLGTLFVAIGDSEVNTATKGRSHYQKALEFLTQARKAYEEGFSEGHPKVAWALEGIANAYQKSGDLRKAHQVWEEVIRIREKLQQEGDGKQLFSKELVKASEAVAKVEAARAAARVKFQQRVGMVAGAARGVKAVLGGGGLSPSGSQGSMSELVSSETISPSKGGGLHELRRPLLGQVAREGAGAASGQDLRERGGEAGRLVSDAQGM